LYNEAAMQALRQIPPVNDVLRSPELANFRDVLGQPFATAIIDTVFSDVRRELSDSKNGTSRSELTTRIATEIARRLRDTLRPSLRRVINASGVVLHTNLGRAPLPDAAIEQLRLVSAGYSNLEFDIEEGRRGKRDVHVGRILQELLGCESAVVVNNNAAAVLLVLNTLAEGGEVIVSRGEQVEIGESFRIPDIMARSGARLCEVGSTNRTRIKDYENAIGENTRLLLRVHPSNFRMIGFTERPSLSDFVDLGRRRHVPTFEDLGSGCLAESTAFPDEPGVNASIRAGVDVVSFSGDKLVGGPQAGIIAGKKIYVDRIRQNPLFRALRVDKLTIAILEYVIRAYLRGELDAIPAWKMVRTAESELQSRSEKFAQRAGPAARPMQLKSIVGGGSAPETYLLSWGVALEIPGMSTSELERRLRISDPPVIVRIEDARVVLDFRTIFETDEEELLRIIRERVPDTSLPPYPP
jgi:L-seryl-tRNA(Ser) seleniumtransferase